MSVVARYPNTGINASGWLRGEDFMLGHAAVVAIDMNPGKVVLFGIRPQHRAQTHATFPLLFNALYWSTESARRRPVNKLERQCNPVGNGSSGARLNPTFMD